MALEPYQVQANQKVTLDGDGSIFSTDPHLTYVVREDGKVDIYTTEHVAENAELYEEGADAPAPRPIDSPREVNRSELPNEPRTDNPPADTRASDVSYESPRSNEPSSPPSPPTPPAPGA